MPSVREQFKEFRHCRAAYLNRLRAWFIALPIVVILACGRFSQQASGEGISDYLENKLIDALLRGQSFQMPEVTYIGLAVTEGSDAACGKEVSGGNYARVAFRSSLTNWAGTQAPKSTALSSGTSGATSNNNPITFPTPTSNWGKVVEFCVFDAPTGGNLLFRAVLMTKIMIKKHDVAPSFPVGAMTYQIDK